METTVTGQGSLFGAMKKAMAPQESALSNIEKNTAETRNTLAKSIVKIEKNTNPTTASKGLKGFFKNMFGKSAEAEMEAKKKAKKDGEEESKFRKFMKEKWGAAVENKKVIAFGGMLKKIFMGLLAGFAIFALPKDFWVGIGNSLLKFGQWILEIDWKGVFTSIQETLISIKKVITKVINSIFGTEDKEGNRQGGLLGKGGIAAAIFGEDGAETMTKFVAAIGTVTAGLAIMFPGKAFKLVGKAIWGLTKLGGKGVKSLGGKAIDLLGGGREGMATRSMTPEQLKMSQERAKAYADNAKKAGPRVGKSSGGGWFKKLMGKFGKAGKFLMKMGKSVIKGLMTMGPYGWAILGGIALGGLVWYFWDDVTKVWDSVSATISEGFTKVKTMVVGAFQNVQGMVGGWLRGIGAGMIADWIDPKGADPEKKKEFTWGGFAGELWTIYKGIWTKIFSAVKGIASKVKGWGISILKAVGAPGWLLDMLGGNDAPDQDDITKEREEGMGKEFAQMSQEERNEYQKKNIKDNAGKGGAGEVIQAPRSKKVRLEENEGQIANTKASISRIASRKGGATAGGIKEMNRLNEQLKGLQDVNKSIKSEQGDGEVSNTLSSSDKTKLKEALGKRESGGKYDVLNSLGFSGKYQFGDMALEDMGLLKKGASKLGSVAKVTGDPNNWNLKGGLSTWLSTGGLQESSMDRLMSNNLRVLQGAPGFKQFKRGDIAGALAAAHLVGAGGAKKFLAGNDSADAYGTKASDYFALGKNVIEAKEGFHGVVKKEIWFRTGEAGPERVDISPMRDPNAKTQAMNSLQNENASGKMGNAAPTIINNAPQTINNSGGGETYLPLPATAKHDKFDI
jgi:hypothetical protein